MLRNSQYGVHRGMPHLASAKRFSKTTTPLNHLCFFPLKTRPRHILQVCAWDTCFTAYRKCCILEITASTAGRLGFEAAERSFPALLPFLLHISELLPNALNRRTHISSQIQILSTTKSSIKCLSAPILQKDAVQKPSLGIPSSDKPLIGRAMRA